MKNYVDKDKLHEYTTKLTAKNKTIFATKAEVGSPLVASTVAEMTDQNRVYVYTGSESGYTFGNWYYYDGSAWTSGGVYNSAAIQTDTTLSIPGMAADAKSVGDALENVEIEVDATLTQAGMAADAKATGDVVNDLKSAIDVMSGAEYVQMNLGYIRTNIESGINKDTVNSSTTNRYAVVPCVEGDTFTIRAYTAGGAYPRAYAFIDTNGNRLSASGSGEECNGIVITAPENAAYAIIQSRVDYDPYCIKGITASREISLIKDSMRDTLTLIGYANGYMLASGVQYGSAENNIRKYAVRSGVGKIYITGTSTMNVQTNAFCVLWFVSGGSMMTGGYVPVTSKPQSWNEYEVNVPSGAEEVWLHKNFSIITSTEYEYDIGQRIRNIEVSMPDVFFDGPFTWTERVFGLRMLADAQGCYFIPFNALGQGVSRGNGTYGDYYYDDNIHPTRLGAYNLAVGVWSYLRHIPCWHTSLPADTSTAPSMDGTQWAGKSWYAYGTSLTAGTIGSAGSSTSNRYADFVQAMSGLVLTNKGYGGGALVTNRQIYNRLLDMTDGKLDADLITIEVGANDSGETGNPWSINTNEFYGALNHCIREMFAAGVKAQIVIMASYPPRYAYNDATQKYDVNRLLNNG